MDGIKPWTNKLLYKYYLGKLNQLLVEGQNKIWEGYQEARLTRTKEGMPVYLIHVAAADDLGNIHILTRNGLDGNLQYLVGGEKEKYLRICDTRYRALNQGIGSEVIAFLEEIARHKQCDRINGWLSPVDLNDHGERLLHFCDKNGFKLTEEKTSYSNVNGLYATKYFQYA